MSGVARAANEAVAYRARWVIPVDRPPIEGGVVTIAGRRIVEIGRNASSQPPRDLGDVALLPGFVNAHTHLEFSLLERPLGSPGMAFPDWIRLVVERRRQEAKSLMVETDGFQRFRRRAATAGLAEMRASGSVALADVATPGWPRECFPADDLDVTIFLELLGLDSQREEGLLAMASSFVLDLQDAAGGLRPGISPHAPYTVSPKLVERACQLSNSERCPVAMHLAESRDELELLAHHAGPLVEMLNSLSAWHAAAVPRGKRPLDYLRLLATAHRALVIHGNYLAQDEIDFLAVHRQRMSVVYCPRTHAYFGHKPYPLTEMLTAGVRVAIGTDSRASNPDLRLLEELRHTAQHHPAVSPDDILRMGTLSAAEALCIADKYGSITVGKSAALTVVPLPADSREPLIVVLAAESSASSARRLEDMLRHR
jgi:cytosine/adenosine deaminase-related metal-dependent hydrolase